MKSNFFTLRALWASLLVGAVAFTAKADLRIMTYSNLRGEGWTCLYPNGTDVDPNWAYLQNNMSKTAVFKANRPDGHQVEGWYWNPNSSYVALSGMQKVTPQQTYLSVSQDNLSCTASYDATIIGTAALGVRFDYIPFTLTFAANGGSGSMSSITDLNIASNQVLPQVDFTRTGYHFDGWTNAVGKSFADTATVKGTDLWNADTWSFDAALSATWAANAYQVVFDGNGATSGSMNPLDCTYDQQSTLPANAFVKSGWAFAGWSRTPGGQKAFDDKAPVKNLTAEAGGVITLYALWAETLLTVTFDANGEGAAVSPESKGVYKGETYGDLPVPVRTGYGSTGWWTAQSGGTLITADSTVGQVGQQTLYAHWTNNQYVVTFDAKGGTVTPSSIVVTFDQYYSNLPTPAKANSAFAGWFMTEGGSQEVTANTQVKTANDHTLYARWVEKKTYMVTFDQQGGTGGTNEVIATLDETLPPVPVPSREGFLFEGYWDEVEGGGSQYYSKDGVGQNWDKEEASTLYAKWTLNSYTVAFDSNGATNWVKTQLMTWNDYHEHLASNEYAKVGYAFAGWAKDRADAQALKVTYEDGQLVERNMAELGETNTLWAVWNTNTYWIAFDANGGAGDAMPVQEFKYDVPQRLYANEYKPQKHYEFLGWSEDKSAGEPSYTNEEQVVNLWAEDGKTNTFYAVWRYVPSVVSAALDCTNLYFTGDAGWRVDEVTSSHEGQTCLASDTGRPRKTIGAETEGLGGTLTFWWKGAFEEGDPWAGTQDKQAKLIVEYEDENGAQASRSYEANAANMAWTLPEEIKIPARTGQKITFSHEDDVDGMTCWLDHVTWTPDEPEHPQPGPGDAVTVSSASVSGDKFVLSFAGDERFDYGLLTNADLTVEQGWGLMEKKPGAAGVTFEPLILEGVPQMFYKVETLQKQGE